MFNLLKSNQPISFVILPIIVLIVLSIDFFDYISVVTPTNNSLIANLISFSVDNVYVLLLVKFILLTIISIQINFLVSRHDLLKVSSNISGVLFLLLCAFLPSSLYNISLLFATILWLFAFEKLFHLFHANDARKIVFDGALLMSLSSLFDIQFMFLYMLIGVALINFKPFYWRDWAIALIGLLIPYIFIATYYFFMHHNIDIVMSDIKSLFNQQFTIFFNRKTYHWGIAAFIIIIGIRPMINFSFNNKVKISKNIIFLLSFMVASLLLFVYNYSSNKQYWLLVVIPLSVYFANALLAFKKKWQPELVFWILISAIVYNRFGYLYF